MSLLHRFAAAAAFSCFLAPALAEEEQKASLEEMIVTATRTPVAAHDLVAPVVIIDRDTIERSLAADLAELLRFHAGFDIGRNGGPGQTTSLFIRGTESNHALVLIDGVEINPGTIGGAALQNIPLESIERIEIVKGPRSSLYGSEAIGGVVNVITRRAVAGSRLGARAGAGRYATGEATGAWDWTDGTTRAGVTLGHLQSDGYAIREDSDVERGYERNTLNAYAEKTRGDWRFGVRHWEARGTAEYLGFAFPPAAPPPLDQDFTNRVTAFEAGYDAAHGLRSRFTLSRAEDDIRQNQSADFAQTKRLAFDWQNDLDLGAHHTLTVGLYRSAEDAATETFGAPIDEQTDVNALYLQDQWRDGRHTAVLAARATDHETFGRHTSWNADYGYALGGATRLTLGAGRGFRAPDATDLYSPFCGNPALEPEIARNAEAGLRHDFGGRHMLRGSLFAMDIDDLIVAVFDPVTFECEMRNLERARIRGLELAYSYVVDAWRIETEAIWQDPENRDTGRQLARRAERSFTARALRRFGDLEVGADLLATSARPDSDFSTTINAGYVLTNLTARYRLAPALALSARLENVFDTDYVTAAGYRNPGRSLFVALEYRGE